MTGMNKFKILISWVVLVVVVISGTAATPPAEQLLPADTIAVASIRDLDQWWQVSSNSPYRQLWQDPAMKPFRDRFEARFAETVRIPLEKELGITFTNYQDLIHGQMTFALLPSAIPKERNFDWVLMLDTKEKGAHLKAALDALRTKWVAGGQQVKTEKIREIEFSHLTFPQEQINASLRKLMSGASESAKDDVPKSAAKFQLIVGQSQSLLLLGNSTQVLEKVLIRQSGVTTTPLADQSAFKIAKAKSLLDAQAYLVFLGQPLYAMAAKLASGEDSAPSLGVPTDKVLAATGLAGVQAVSLKLGNTPEGTMFELFAAIPESARQGLLSLFLPQVKESSPVALVPADVTKFRRIRLDGHKTWTGFESLIKSIDLGLFGLLQLAIGTAGKDVDPNFDFKKNLIGNLGDDIITYEKLPKILNAQSLIDPPTTVLIGSPNAIQLLQALRASLSILPAPLGTTPITEREFLGRKIYIVTLSEDVDESGIKLTPQFLHVSAHGGYVVFSRDPGSVEEYLRNADAPGNSLRDTPGLARAAQTIGGFNTGLFGYENQVETTRINFELLRKDPSTFESVMFGFPIPLIDSAPDKGWQALFDFTLLPPFNQVSKYFHFKVNSLAVSPEGISYKVYSPTLPSLRK